MAVLSSCTMSDHENKKVPKRKPSWGGAKWKPRVCTSLVTEGIQTGGWESIEKERGGAKKAVASAGLDEESTERREVANGPGLERGHWHAQSEAERMVTRRRRRVTTSEETETKASVKGDGTKGILGVDKWRWRQTWQYGMESKMEAEEGSGYRTAVWYFTVENGCTLVFSFTARKGTYDDNLNGDHALAPDKERGAVGIQVVEHRDRSKRLEMGWSQERIRRWQRA
ncbi:hypothetical protein BJY52DRAFT_1225863 [Lactarius psammicola]|nr:hypothetical protein BJY52DRAFT_1225863 [Lactarius psammicola]